MIEIERKLIFLMKEKIKFGIQIEPQLGYKYEEVLKIAKQAEKIGYDSLWASDHFFLNDKSEDTDCMEAWTLLTAIAAQTSTLRVGALVTGNNYRYPAVLAKIAATLDRISEGRLEFGLGAGWKQIEYDAYGITFPSVKDRMDQLEESIQIIKKLWTESSVNFNGKHYKLKNAFSAPKPVQKLPPIFIGGSGKKRTLNIVAKYADYLNFGWFTEPKEIPILLDITKKHCEDVNRDYKSLRKSFFAYVIMGETEEKLDELIENLASKNNLTKEDFKKRFGEGVFIGLPEEVNNKFKNMIEIGFDYFQIMFPYGNDLELSKEFAELVMKKL